MFKDYRCGFTLMELLVASGIVSVLTIMISVIVLNISKIVSLQSVTKGIEENLALNDICAWVSNIDNINLCEDSRFSKVERKNQVWFGLDENARSHLPFILYENNEIGSFSFGNNRFVVSFDKLSGSGNVYLNKYIILSDNAKAAYLRPVYTEKYFEDKKQAGLFKGLLSKDITSWNNDQKMTLCYDSVKKLQELKKDGKIASVHLVVENNKPQATQSSSKKKFWFF